MRIGYGIGRFDHESITNRSVLKASMAIIIIKTSPHRHVLRQHFNGMQGSVRLLDRGSARMQ